MTSYDEDSQRYLKVTLRLLLIRHGLSSFNCENRIQGRIDHSKLTSEGQNQAFKAGEALQGVKIDAIYSSPLQRALTTAKTLKEASNCSVKPIVDEGLLEIDLGIWGGLTIEEVRSKHPSDYEIWCKNPQELVLKDKDGRSFNPIKELKEQAQSFIRSLIERHPIDSNQTVVIVAHNAILRCIILLLLKNPDLGFRRIKLNNASISVFNLTESGETNFQVQIECLNSTTHLTPQIPIKGKGARIILVRHGETDWNKQGRFQGQIDIPLNKKGLEQASAAGQFLKKVSITRAFSSTMTRPKQTARTILKFHLGIELEVDKDLMEIGHGLWEGKLESEIQISWPELLEIWKTHPEKVEMPEGESINIVWERAVRSWNKIRKELSPEDTGLVVAHDAVNKTILCNLLGLSSSDIWMVKQGNGGVTIVDISDDPTQPAVVSSLNLTSHLGGLLDNTAAGAL